MRTMPARNVLLAAVLAAGLVGAQVQPASAAVLVKAGANCQKVFSPKGVTVSKGTKVVWKAVCISHTVTAYSKNWSKDVTLTKGETTSKVFKATGVFKYHCKFHSSVVNGVCSGMCGRVRVT